MLGVPPFAPGVPAFPAPVLGSPGMPAEVAPPEEGMDVVPVPDWGLEEGIVGIPGLEGAPGDGIDGIPDDEDEDEDEDEEGIDGSEL
jgi:hypothetical protein